MQHAKIILLSINLFFILFLSQNPWTFYSSLSHVNSESLREYVDKSPVDDFQFIEFGESSLYGRGWRSSGFKPFHLKLRMSFLADELNPCQELFERIRLQRLVEYFGVFSLHTHIAKTIFPFHFFW